MTKFTEEQLEAAIIDLFGQYGYPHVSGKDIQRSEQEVLLADDLRAFLRDRYKDEGITSGEIDTVIRYIESFSALDLYESNKAISKVITDGYPLTREDPDRKDLRVYLLDYDDASRNNFKIVNQLEIYGECKRIPDAIVYINGLPLVLFEFKSAVRPEATIHDAFIQITTRYNRDIPELLKYNAFCVISDGVNNRAGTAFSEYDFFYSWRKVTGDEKGDAEGIKSLHTMVEGMFDHSRLCDIIRNFIFFPDVSKEDVKILCRYPQYYAARKLYNNILEHRKPDGDGKGGTYFGATGCGKSFTMLFLSRLLMKSVDFASPTIILITDRTELDDQLAEDYFLDATKYIGDDNVISVSSRSHLRELLAGRASGGVFLTTIHKFNEDIKLLTERSNVICISDEAHRSQLNLDQTVKRTKDGVKKTFGFAKHLHDSLPNATFVGFTGTPIDATMDVFGDVVDSYTMAESVRDGITVSIVYEGRAAKVLLNSTELEKIEKYYAQCAEDGANEYQIDESKKASTSIRHILGDPDRLEALAKDFIEHYENRVEEGATVKGKAMFVCSCREIGYDFYKKVIELRPQWAEKKIPEEKTLTEKERKDIKPVEMVKMVMTRGKDDKKDLYDLLGTEDHRKELKRQFKFARSNFKIAIVVDMWLTGFDVPFLDSMYIDKPVKRHNLIQTISRVNRKYKGKEKGLVVDYIGIKKQMNLALAKYSKADKKKIEEIDQSVVVVKDHLKLLGRIFHKFDDKPYFEGTPLQQLNCLEMAAEYVQITHELEKRFMYLVERLKAAYDICCGSDRISERERDYVHFYLAVRSIIFKLTKGDTPDITQMNARVREMIKDALESDGVEEVFRMGEQSDKVDIFSENYMAMIDKIKLPHTKIKLLQQLLAKMLEEYQKVNKFKSMDFSEKFRTVVDRYNERRDDSTLVSEVLDDFTDEIIDLINSLKTEMDSFEELGIDFEEKAFYDILKGLAVKYDFTYPEDKLLVLAREVKKVVDDKARYTDWSKRTDIKAELKVDLIILLAEHGYPPVDRDEVYKEIFEQAENFKKYQKS